MQMHHKKYKGKIEASFQVRVRRDAGVAPYILGSSEAPGKTSVGVTRDPRRFFLRGHFRALRPIFSP